MAYEIIQIPGGRTTYEDAPAVRVHGESDESVRIVIVYRALAEGAEGPAFGELTFTDVLEYRWRSQSVSYEEHDEHARDFKFGLIEVLNSRYVETMAARGKLRQYPGERFGLIPESAVHHYRVGFDNYGTFDVIALGVSIREITERHRPLQ